MSKIKSCFSKIRSCTPKASRIIFIITALCVPLLALFYISPSFADFYNRYPAAFFRGVLAVATSWFPLSFAEIILIVLPVAAVILIIYVCKIPSGENKKVAKLCISMISVIAYILSSFVLGLAAGYRGSSLDVKLGIERCDVTSEELDTTARKILAELDKLLPEVTFKNKSFSVMPYSVGKMNDILQDDYNKAADKYDFLPVFRSRIKPVMLSVPMTYTHISGVYTYFTGESNLNVNFPDYDLPYTAAHELAHQRGIAREDEANFVAFLICKDSSDPYVRYSGYMSLYEYVISALYDADSDAYMDLLGDTDKRLLYEMISYDKFYDKYKENVAATVSGTINDTYLKIQGQKEGSKSYGMVVDLAVAYFKN